MRDLKGEWLPSIRWRVSCIPDSSFLLSCTSVKHKLAATVSPNKTVEGAVWGAASSLVVGVICWLLGRWFPAVGGMNLIACMVTCLLASTMGQLGDLAESLLKRMLGVKDFSNLIPGHGGMFDRADSLLFSIPTAYLCIMVYTMLAV